MSLYEMADEIIEINYLHMSLTEEERLFIREIIIACLEEEPESEKTERFFYFAMSELSKNK